MTPAAVDPDLEKAAAARAAVAEVRDGMIVGLGTGSTVAFAIAALAERCRSGLAVHAVATSLHTEAAARRSGITIVDFSALSAVDLCIDGVDEIDADFRAIKGGGGAMLREKIVARAATRMVAIADSSKVVQRLGLAPLPIEVVPFALGFVGRQVDALGGRPTVRLAVDGSPYRTDQGNAVIDCAFGVIADPATLAGTLSSVPGLIGHGLFLGDIDALYIGRGNHVERLESRP